MSCVACATTTTRRSTLRVSPPVIALPAADVLGQTMHGCGRVSFGISFLFTTGKRTLGPSDRVSIIALDHLRVVEDLPSLAAVTRMQFPKFSLAFMPIERSVAFLIMKYGPKLEAWIGYGESSIVSICHVPGLVESRMVVPIEHRPYGIPVAKSIAFRLSRFFNRTFNHCSGISGATNQDQSCGRPISMETIEFLETAGLCNGSFGNDHDPQGRPANRGALRLMRFAARFLRLTALPPEADRHRKRRGNRQRPALLRNVRDDRLSRCRRASAA